MFQKIIIIITNSFIYNLGMKCEIKAIHEFKKFTKFANKSQLFHTIRELIKTELIKNII